MFGPRPFLFLPRPFPFPLFGLVLFAGASAFGGVLERSLLGFWGPCVLTCLAGSGKR